MGILFKQSPPDKTAELKKEIDQMQAAGEGSAALASMAFRAMIATDRATGAGVVSDEMILTSAEFIEYSTYEDNRDYDTIGEIIQKDGLFYEIKAKHTSNAVAYPVETTFAYYRLIELKASGSLEEPIPYPETQGILVSVLNGLHYSYKRYVYRAEADLPNCVWPPDTPMWQWVKIGEVG